MQIQVKAFVYSLLERSSIHRKDGILTFKTAARVALSPNKATEKQDTIRVSHVFISS